MNGKAETLREYSNYALLAAAFFIPIFIGAAEGFMYLAILLWGILLLWKKQPLTIFKHPATLFIFAFAGLAVASIWFGEDAARSLKKSHRLLLLFAVFAVPGVLTSHHRDARRLLFAFVCGASVLAVYDIVRIPAHWLWDLNHIDQVELHGRTLEEYKWFLLYDKGNMRDPQFYMVTLLILFSFYPVYQAAHKRPMLGLMALNLAALLLHNKRGAWLAFLIASILCLLLSRTGLGFLRNKKVWAIGLVGLVLVGAYSKNRLGDLIDEFDPNHGGRFELWSKVFIPFMEDHPIGVGYLAVKHEQLTAYTTDLSFTVKNHFHNNPLQVAAELGWAGLAIWLAWMIAHLAMFLICRRIRHPEISIHMRLAQAGMLAFVALLIDGMVEYNFGDTEPYMLFIMLMGLSVWLWQQRGRDAVAC